MLQRAASNAYSWWWASHIRTKQSKWLEQNLQDMEGKVEIVLKLIEEDGDSFAKRAEMYYKKRPELINFVEESFRAYRALAERYDHLSRELQNANNTIATVFPEQVQFAADDEDECGSPRVPKTFSQASTNDGPKVPKFPSRDLKALLSSNSSRLHAKKSSKAVNTNKTSPKSGLSKSEALEEIDKLQKEILAQQTAKTFVKSSFESGLTKYWEIENRMTELQERVSNLQDEFMVGKVTEDDEARTLMAEAALRSCEEALAELQEKQEKSAKDAREEYQRVQDAREKFNSLKHKFLPNQQATDEKPNDEYESAKSREKQEFDALKEKIKDHFEVDSKEALTVTELAEKIDELVSKVISLETAASSQTALIDTLRTETDDLQTQILILEDDKATLIDGTNTLTSKLKEMEEKFVGLQDLNQNVESQSNDLQTHFIEARRSLDQLSEKLLTVKPDEEIEYMESLQEEDSSTGGKTPEELEKREYLPSLVDGYTNSTILKKAVGEAESEQVVSICLDNEGEIEEEKVCQVPSCDDGDTILEKREDPISLDKYKHGASKNVDPKEVAVTKVDGLSWQEMLLNGLEDREIILMTEYSEILRNYKDAKKKLSNVETENRDSLFETTLQLRELRTAVAKRDVEIHSLRQKLNLLHDGNKDLKEDSRQVSIMMGDRSAKPDITEEDVKLVLIDQPKSVSLVEEKIRMNIDALLDENLDFWLRFSTSYHHIQKFKTGFQDLKVKIAKITGKQKLNHEPCATTDIKSDLRLVYQQLREVQTDLTLWIEQSTLLKVELQRRFSSLCNIQEDITKALKAGAEEEEMKFTSHEAAKFQGEVLNMKQENNKVRDELQAGLDHVTKLQQEIEMTLTRLGDEFGLPGFKNNTQSQLGDTINRTRVPLRAFIFGKKSKKKSSIFSFIHHRRNRGLRAGSSV